MKFAFFFSYSFGTGCDSYDCQQAVAVCLGAQRTDEARAPFAVGLLGAEPFSLISDMLVDGLRLRAVLVLRWLNWTSLRGRVMLATGGCAGCAGGGRGWRCRDGVSGLCIQL